MLQFKSDKEICRLIGSRLVRARLEANKTQEAVAKAANISITAVQKAEKGESKLITYIKIFRVLGLLDQIDSFLPEPPISPIAVAKMKGKERERASGKRTKVNDNG